LPTISGLDLSDFTLTRDGTPVSLAGATLSTNGANSYSINNLQAINSRSGNYVLTLRSLNSGIADVFGNPLAAPAVASWTVAALETSAVFGALPALVNAATSVVSLSFMNPMGSFSGLDTGDFRLTRDGKSIPMTGATVSGSGANFTLNSLAGLTAAAGRYILSLDGSSSGIVDGAGNPFTGSAAVAWTVDTAAPLAVLTAVRAIADAAVGSVEIVFSENIRGLDPRNLLLTRGFEKVDLTGVTLVGSGSRYLLDNLASITEAAGEYAITILSASGITDLAGNPLTVATRTTWVQSVADNTPPSLVLSTTSPLITNAASFVVTVMASENVAGLAASMISVLNGTVTNLAGSDTSYTFTVTPLANGQVTVSIPSGGTKDIAGNFNVASNILTIPSDRSGPVAKFTPLASTATAGIATAAIGFGEPVTGIAKSLFSLTRNGVAVDLTSAGITIDESAASLTGLSLLTSTDGTYVLAFSAVTSAVVDGAGNLLRGDASISWTKVTPDTAPPTVTLSSRSSTLTNSSAIVVTARFSETVTGLEARSVAVVNGSVTSITASGTTYTLTIRPAADGTVSVSIPAGATRDLAGNVNVASAPLTFVSDRTAPSAVTVAPPNSKTYKAGESLTFTVNYRDKVTVLGLPYMSVMVGANLRQATYAGKAGDNALVFRYTIVANETDQRGVIMSRAITLPAGATIKDDAGNNAQTVIPAANTTGVKVDAVAPTVTNVVIPASSLYGVGRVLEFRLAFNKSVSVQGLPTLALKIGTITRQAVFNRIDRDLVTNNSILVFRYTTVLGDVALSGIDIAATISLASGASISDAAGNPARLTFTAPSAKGIRIFAR
jgi:hypothetical protein